MPCTANSRARRARRAGPPPPHPPPMTAIPTTEFSEREQHILKLLVDQYIELGTPVGSRTLSRLPRHRHQRRLGAQRHVRPGADGAPDVPAHLRRPHPDLQGVPGVRRQPARGAPARRGDGRLDPRAARPRPRRAGADQRRVELPVRVHPHGRHGHGAASRRQAAPAGGIPAAGRPPRARGPDHRGGRDPEPHHPRRARLREGGALHVRPRAERGVPRPPARRGARPHAGPIWSGCATTWTGACG